ncbi:MAG: ATP-binding cassette domain-containing protein [Saprospiraceae bacterium]|nr:ATP-binding cassette domain-containing protein [Saprospiraceae bacterium]
MKILSIHGITKSYGRIEAIKNLDLEVEPGQVYGILGPNGSGKTTTLSIVLGIIRQDKGMFQWFDGKYGRSVRTRLGALLETPNFYPYLDADDNLGIIRHIKRSHESDFSELLELVQLSDRRKSKFISYSLGMRQRLAIAAALVGDPEVLILDEPTNGLDPEGIADVRSTISDIASMGKTIIMASHMLDEVEKVCTHVAILKKGELLTHGPVGAILSDEITVEVGSVDLSRLEQALHSFEGVSNIIRKMNFFEISVSANFDVGAMNLELMNKGIVANHLQKKRHSLEDEFLEIIK